MSKTVIEDEPTFADWCRVMEYHYNRMDRRRSIEMKVFTGYVVFLLLVVKGVADTDGIDMSLVPPWFLWLPFVGLVLFLIQIEVQNRDDRDKYKALEKVIDGKLKAESPNLTYGALLAEINNKRKGFRKVGAALEMMRVSWAANWPIAVAAALTWAAIELL